MILSLILHKHENDPITLHSLFKIIVGISYFGDIRMNWNLENPNKI